MADALQAWIRSYRSFVAGGGGEFRTTPGVESRGGQEDATAELTALDVEKLLRQRERSRSEPRTEPRPSVSDQTSSASSTSAFSQQKGEFTRLFGQPEAFQQRASKSVPESPAATPSKPVQPISSELPDNATGFATSFGAGEEKPKPGSADLGPPGVGSSQPEFGQTGSFTQLFSGAGNDSAGSGFESAPPPKPTGAKEPGAFTKEFLAIAGKAQPGQDSATDPGTRTAAPPTKGPPSVPTFPAAPPPGSGSSARPPRSEASLEGQKGGTGEFTSFFRGPFDQPRPSDKPLDFPDAVQTRTPPKAGEFTQMFGPETRLGPQGSPKITQPEPESSQAPSFTQIFSEEAKGARLGDARLGPDTLSPEPLKPPVRSTPSAPVAPPVFSGTGGPSAGSFTPPDLGRAPAGENTFVGSSSRSGATEMFKHPRGDAPIAEPELPSGPSDFTMFVSRSQLRGGLPPEPPTPGAPSPVAVPPPVAMPPVPAYTPPAPPPMPAPVVPPMPAAKMPAPPTPKPAPVASYWPLITVLTVLFFVAAMLVMYFALKH